jgi:hypothetical protein
MADGLPNGVSISVSLSQFTIDEANLAEASVIKIMMIRREATADAG